MIDYGDVEHLRNARRHTRPDDREKGEYRTPAQRDRDRILYTSAFRRLAEVTQVASPDHSQVFHNRLTHSLQVAQVGRSLAQRLRKTFPRAVDDIGGIDPDVVEAACLAHDIGHPPFGHTAEKVLNTLAGKRVGGFEGNAQSFRVVTHLAFKSEEYAGLDLTRATLAAILKYPWKRYANPDKRDKWGAYESELTDFRFARKLSPGQRFNPTPEAELMNWADDVTYSVHDIEDFYRAGRIPMHLLARFKPKGTRFILDSPELEHFFDDVYRRHAGEKRFFKRDDLEQAFAGVVWPHWRIKEPYSGTQEQRQRLRYFTAQLIHRYINCVNVSREKKSVSIGEAFEQEVAVLKELTWTYVIEAPALAAQREGQRSVITRLFGVYADASESEKKWGLFPHYHREMLKKNDSRINRMRIVVDLIAGMTEPQAIATFRQFTGAWPSSSLEEIVR